MTVTRLTTRPTASPSVEEVLQNAWFNLSTVVAETGEWEIESAAFERRSVAHGYASVEGPVTFVRVGSSS